MFKTIRQSKQAKPGLKKKTNENLRERINNLNCRLDSSFFLYVRSGKDIQVLFSSDEAYSRNIGTNLNQVTVIDLLKMLGKSPSFGISKVT